MTKRQAICATIATFLLISIPAARSSAQGQGAFVKRPTVNVRAMRALKSRFHNGDYREVSQLAYKLLWEDVYQPEILRYLGASLKEIGKPEDAAAVMHILLRVLDFHKARHAGGGVEGRAVKKVLQLEPFLLHFAAQIDHSALKF